MRHLGAWKHMETRISRNFTPRRPHKRFIRSFSRNFTFPRFLFLLRPHRNPFSTKIKSDCQFTFLGKLMNFTFFPWRKCEFHGVVCERLKFHVWLYELRGCHGFGSGVVHFRVHLRKCYGIEMFSEFHEFHVLFACPS